MSGGRLLSVLLVALAVTPSCRLFRRTPKQPPTVATPIPRTPPPSEPPKPVVLPAPPSLPPASDAGVKEPPIAEANIPPAPPKAPKRAAQPRTRPGAVKPETETVEAPKPEPTPPVAQLGELISESQRRELNRQIDQSLERARQNLGRLASRTVSAEEAEARQRIESFIKQAEATRKDDPVTAKSLAERAEVLSQDLARK